MISTFITLMLYINLTIIDIINVIIYVILYNLLLLPLAQP